MFNNTNNFMYNLVYSKYWFWFVLIVITPMNIFLMFTGQIVLGGFLILMQIPYII